MNKYIFKYFHFYAKLKFISYSLNVAASGNIIVHTNN